MSQEHILRKRIECNLELDHVSKETGISAKLIRAIEQADKKPFSSVLSYKMTERKLDNLLRSKIKYESQGERNSFIFKIKGRWLAA